MIQNDHMKIKKMSRLNVFLMMFPSDHLNKIISLTNPRLRSQGHVQITKGVLVKFLSILILGNIFEFGGRRELWSTTFGPQSY